ncbi:MAG: GntR family transcriptional regulator [Gammaproteobacteria bacterium]|nr:MAG: GntR family transcriptional regulator [Gammaproteobacteria bacterium]UCH40303.1 MAG: GntR family transcriptional regulator [Gammaproteobacteria bacterium]
MKATSDIDSGKPTHAVEQQRGSLRSHVENTVRAAIFDGLYPAGQKLVERELCDLTGASRSILREALVSLEVSGLIERESNRGYRVSLLSARQVYEIFELRASLETLAAELFAERASDAEMQQLAQLLEDLEACIASGDLTQMRLVKERYYELLFSGCRNREIRRALENIIDRVHYLRGRLMSDPDRRQKSLEEMRRLTAALLARDRLQARAASIAHLTAARDTVLEGMLRKDETETAGLMQ